MAGSCDVRKEFFIGHAGAGDIKPELNSHISNGMRLAWLFKCGCSIRGCMQRHLYASPIAQFH
jgi:hypothetical protein